MKYQIRDWSRHFENNRSRQIDQCNFVCVPNKQHGMGLAKILRETDGAAIYGIWHLIVGFCSQQRLPRDGWVTLNAHHDGTPASPADLALKFRRPVAEVERALTVLSSCDVGWLQVHNSDSDAQVTPKCPPSDAQVRLSDEEGRKEGRKEGRDPKHSFSETPSWDEFWDYCQMHGGPVEWYVRDKYLAAESDNWKGKSNWTAYAERIRQWWVSAGSPTKPQKSKSDNPKRKMVAV